MKKHIHQVEQNEKKESTPVKSYYLLISLIPIYLFFSMINRYAVNIPMLDDWDAILGFIIDWTKSPNDEKFRLLMSQHNEHRIVVSRVIYVLYYSISNKINFINLGIISNLQLLVIFGILVYFSAKFIKNTWPIISIFIAFCIFDASNYENSMMSMAGMANYGVIMLFLISLLCYSSQKYSLLIVAIVFQILCIYSNGNGIIGGFVLVLFCVATRNRLKLFSSIITFAASSILYFQQYHKTENNLTGKSLVAITEFFLRLIGGHLGPDHRIFIGIIFLIAIMLIIYFLSPKILKGDKESFPFLATILFIILSMGSVAVFRSAEESKIETLSYSSRYLIYPHLYAAILIILIAYFVERTKIKWIAISIIGFIYIKGYTENYKFGDQMFQIYRNRAIFNEYHYPIKQKAANIGFKACEKKIYCLEENRPIE
jgi:hypothetical protein